MKYEFYNMPGMSRKSWEFLLSDELLSQSFLLSVTADQSDAGEEQSPGW